MSANNLLLAGAIGVAVLLVVKKQAQAAGITGRPATGGLLYTPQQQQTANMNGDMWTRLLGGAWRNLASAQNADGTPAFLRNWFGQVTTSDGKPVGGEDPLASYLDVLAGLPVMDSTPNYVGMVSEFDEYLTGIPMNWGQ